MPCPESLPPHPRFLLARCSALEVIARAGAGLDNLDTAAAARLGIPVIFAPGANTNTVAEHTLALMLDLARGITRSARAVAAGRWEERAHYAGNELGGLTLGIIGLGHIGRRRSRSWRHLQRIGPPHAWTRSARASGQPAVNASRSSVATPRA